MTFVKIDSRDIIYQVESATPDTWLRVENLANVTVNRAENEETADTTDYDSEGAYEQDIMQRGASMALAGQELKDDATGALQPGRARVEEMAGEDKVGYASSQGRVRFRHPLSQTWVIWRCTVSLGETGGATNDKSAWAATITKCGRSTIAAVA
ncbi:phage tail tube protein [Nonomuraea sp. NPDC050547]|uniref:phage tail tube protein n=1 Tax=Nonomuraea sp. NPDC050547 TaxID=3364368 RepID=UPI0037ACAA8D